MAAKSKQKLAITKPSDLPKEVREECKSLVPASVTERYKAQMADARRNGNVNLIKCTPANVENMLVHIAMGMSENAACETCMISRNSWIRWKRELDGLSDNVARARNLAQVRWIGYVEAGMPDDPKLALKALQARYPEDWSEKRDVRVTGSVEHPVLNLEALQEVAAARRKQDILEAEIVGQETHPSDTGSGALPGKTGATEEDSDGMQ